MKRNFQEFFKKYRRKKSKKFEMEGKNSVIKNFFLIIVILASFAIEIDGSSSNNSSSSFNSNDSYYNASGPRAGNDPFYLDNELWSGIIRDCSVSLGFSCVQKNAYDYLDRTFIDADSNYTVFDGFILKRNRDVCYDDCVKENLIVENEEQQGMNEDEEEKLMEKEHREEPEFGKSPLQEITDALSKKAMKFLATRNYELTLPEFLASGAKIRISPKEIDDRGALIRLDFGEDPREMREKEQGRIFKWISKYDRYLQ